MTSNTINNLLIPQISQLPDKSKIQGRDYQEQSRDEFRELLKDEINSVRNEHGINLSIHAAKRLKERNFDLNHDDFMKLKGAMEQLKRKGGSDSLVITEKGAYIFDVQNNTIVTAMDKRNMKENVFTNIDSTLIL